MTSTPEPRWASHAATREYLGIGDATLYRYARTGVLTRHTIGGSVRYDLNEVDDILRLGTITPVRGSDDAAQRGGPAADAIARIRAELPTGKPLIPLVQVHAILDKVAEDLGAGRCTEYGIGDHDCAADGPTQ